MPFYKSRTEIRNEVYSKIRRETSLATPTMAKILVINEPYVVGFCRTQRWPAITRARAMRPPDWLAYCTSVLEQEGHSVKLYDFPAVNWDREKLKAIIHEEQPDVVVLDSTMPSFYSDIECARICKQNSECKVVMVGPHVTIFPEEVLASGNVDIVARGEYEYTVRDVVRKLEEGAGELKEVLGISYIEGGGDDLSNSKIIHTAYRPLIEDLDELPFPAWHHLNLKKYFDATRLYPYMDIIGSRGCPFRCTFCLWPQVMHGRRLRLRAPKKIVDEIEYDLQNFPNIRQGEITFEDDTFTISHERVSAICDEFLNRGVKIQFSVNSRPDITDYSLLKKLKKAGCRLLRVGFESGDQQILDSIGKGIKLSTMINFARLAKNAGLRLHGCFVLGLPGETRESIERTLKFALSLSLDTIQFSAAIPFPGTEFYEMCKREGWLAVKGGDEHSKWSSETCLAHGEQGAMVSYPELSKSYLEHSIDRGLGNFYFRPGYILEFLLDTESLRDLYRKLRGAKNFLAYLLTTRQGIKALPTLMSC